MHEVRVFQCLHVTRISFPGVDDYSAWVSEFTVEWSCNLHKELKKAITLAVHCLHRLIVQGTPFMINPYSAGMEEILILSREEEIHRHPLASTEEQLFFYVCMYSRLLQCFLSWNQLACWQYRAQSSGFAAVCCPGYWSLCSQP